MGGLTPNSSDTVRDEIDNSVLEKEKELLREAIAKHNKNPLGVTRWNNTSTKNHKMDKVPQFTGNRQDPFEVAQHLERFGTYFCMAHPHSAVNIIWPNGLAKICNDTDHVALVETIISTVHAQAITHAINRIQSLSQELALGLREIRKTFPEGIQIVEINDLLNELDEALVTLQGDLQVTDTEYQHVNYETYYETLGKSLAKLTPDIVAKAVSVEIHFCVLLKYAMTPIM